MYWLEFLTIALAHLFAVASPGPDFAVVLRQSVSSGTRAGIWTSLGIACAILLHVSYCLLGLALLLSQSPAMFDVMKFVAAGYLFYLGAQSIRLSFVAAQATAEQSKTAVFEPWRAFVLGFLTNGLNPKATLFFLALFTVVIAPSTPIKIQVFYGLYLSVATFLWFAMLTRLLAIQGVRRLVLRAGVWLERVMGAVLIFLAIQLAVSV